MSKLLDWQMNDGKGAAIGTFEQAALFGDIVVLAVAGLAAESVLQKVEDQLAGKTVIDATNPIAAAPPVNGVLQFFTSLDGSLMEKLQKAFPKIHMVKAFNSVGNAFMVNPPFDSKPTMFICGNNNVSKDEVAVILDQFGWEVADMGGMEAARAIEPLCMLWCIPGFKDNSWTHAFKLLRLK